jgi:hypothetical protein
VRRATFLAGLLVLGSWASADEPLVVIESESELSAWLEESGSDGAEPRIVFTDRLQRTAEVHRAAGTEPERWQHLYGCWRRVDLSISMMRKHSVQLRSG